MLRDYIGDEESSWGEAGCDVRRRPEGPRLHIREELQNALRNVFWDDMLFSQEGM